MVDEPRKIRDAEALAALANPFRARIIDALQVDGPSTASTLAARSGQAVGSASHHLKVLAAAGLVEEAPELARDRRERWWRLVTRTWQWSRTDLEDTAARTASEAAEALQLRRHYERAQDWLDNQDAAGPWADAAFVSTTWLRLTPEELLELGVEMRELFARWRERVTTDEERSEPVYMFARGFPAQP
ncbi:ArsR/SmtB family transcription factor [uncultured Jatrophihabitans sp.]|uniref:ArsR/SmtB family transcription factor n=1 Tax=uncultured Jatrophihabitans sp. TaxID=1610747 RepID=UPI0035CAC644